MNIGILGGSFNPITKGHINVAKYVLNSKYNINQVWLLPCYKSSTNKNLVDTQHRLNMCKLAIENESKYQIILCDFEIKNKISGTTAIVLTEFYKTVEKNNYYFIIGMDNAINIERWEDYEKTLQLIPFIAIPRKGYSNNATDPALQPLEKHLWYNYQPHIFIDDSYPDIEEMSSTDIRNIIKEEKEDISYYLYNNVYEYIKSYNLYI